MISLGKPQVLYYALSAPEVLSAPSCTLVVPNFSNLYTLLGELVDEWSGKQVTFAAMSSDLTFLTNDPGSFLLDRFRALLGKNTRYFDCLVGYFFISGFHKLDCLVYRLYGLTADEIAIVENASK